MTEFDPGNTDAAPEHDSYFLREESATLYLCFNDTGPATVKPPAFGELQNKLEAVAANASHLVLQMETTSQWDPLLPARLLQCIYWGKAAGLQVDFRQLPSEISELLRIATAVEPHVPPIPPATNLVTWLHSAVASSGQSIIAFCEFIGAATVAFGVMLTGRANTRAKDILYFIEQAGPKALGIVTLISVLVGMILAYMGALQLRQFGAQIYVANLVGIGMVREMAALMTAIIMAGRTGAAYAAQLGTMQTNEEIDAIETLGMSPMEFLVIPRILALTIIMPLLCIYSNCLDILGGALVATGLDVSLVQYLHQIQGSISWHDISAGLIKSIIYGVLIAIAGCQAGLQCGRSSAAVGEATTSAVVKAIVYIIIADSVLNIVYDKIGI